MKIELNNDQIKQLVEKDLLDCEQVKVIVSELLNNNIIPNLESTPKENEETEPVNDSYNNTDQDITESEPENNNDTLGGENSQNLPEKKCNNHKYLITDEELQGIYDLCKKGHTINYASECYDYPSEVVRAKIKRVFPDFQKIYQSTTLKQKKKVDNDEIGKLPTSKELGVQTVIDKYPKIEENELTQLGLDYHDIKRMYDDYTNVFTNSMTKNYRIKKSFKEISEIEGLEIETVKRILLFYQEYYEPELTRRGVI